MREIKVRVWDKEKNKMVYWNSGMGDTGFWEIYGVFDYPKMLDTGLKDKNGKEIYGGDILKFFFDSERYDYEVYPVEWNHSCWQLGEIYQPLSDYCDVWDCKIIGNIYENLELLKEAK